MTHKIRCRNWCTPQHLLYYLAQLAFRNIDEENLEQKCLDNTNPDCETLCLWTLQLVPHYLPCWQQAGFEQLLSTEAVG